ncbi:MAG: hypothetical protein AAGL99_09910 [Pseudomonadota bacterium]
MTRFAISLATVILFASPHISAKEMQDLSLLTGTWTCSSHQDSAPVAIETSAITTYSANGEMRSQMTTVAQKSDGCVEMNVTLVGQAVIEGSYLVETVDQVDVDIASIKGKVATYPDAEKILRLEAQRRYKVAQSNQRIVELSRTRLELYAGKNQITTTCERALEANS